MSNDQLLVIHSNLDKLLDSKREAMPAGFNKTRFLQNCMAVLQDTKDIDKCDATSVARTMLKGAFLGLDFFNKECYAIVYGENLGTKENPNWIKKVQFQTDYKGERKLAQKYSVRPIQGIYAKVVREGDQFSEEIIDGHPKINFKSLPFSDAKLIGAFAVVNFEDGGMAYDTMSAAEIEKTRNVYSKQADGKAWKHTPGEMYKKTVLRRLCKSIELDFDTIEQAQAFEDAADVDFNKELQPERSKQAEAIDAAFEVIVDEAEQE